MTTDSWHTWVKNVLLAHWARRRLVAIQLSLIMCVAGSSAASKVIPSRQLLLQIATSWSPTGMQAELASGFLASHWFVLL